MWHLHRIAYCLYIFSSKGDIYSLQKVTQAASMCQQPAHSTGRHKSRPGPLLETQPCKLPAYCQFILHRVPLLPVSAALQVTGKELGSRKKKGDPEAAAAPAAASSPQSSRGQKFRARKSREAAAKAATLVDTQQNGSAAAERQAAPAAAPTATSQQESLKVPDAPPPKN